MPRSKTQNEKRSAIKKKNQNIKNYTIGGFRNFFPRTRLLRSFLNEKSRILRNRYGSAEIDIKHTVGRSVDRSRSRMLRLRCAVIILILSMTRGFSRRCLERRRPPRVCLIGRNSKTATGLDRRRRPRAVMVYHWLSWKYLTACVDENETGGIYEAKK